MYLCASSPSLAPSFRGVRLPQRAYFELDFPRCCWHRVSSESGDGARYYGLPRLEALGAVTTLCPISGEPLRDLPVPSLEMHMEAVFRCLAAALCLTAALRLAAALPSLLLSLPHPLLAPHAFLSLCLTQTESLAADCVNRRSQLHVSDCIFLFTNSDGSVDEVTSCAAPPVLRISLDSTPRVSPVRFM